MTTARRKRKLTTMNVRPSGRQIPGTDEAHDELQRWIQGKDNIANNFSSTWKTEIVVENSCLNTTLHLALTLRHRITTHTLQWGSLNCGGNGTHTFNINSSWVDRHEPNSAKTTIIRPTAGMWTWWQLVKHLWAKFTRSKQKTRFNELVHLLNVFVQSSY